MGRISQKKSKIINFFKKGYSIEEIARISNLDEFYVLNVIKTYIKRKIKANELSNVELRISIRNKLKKEIFEKMREKYGFYKI
ncbi:hypothetical protein [Caminibacter mediatlanticus]|uniref:Uncharacterized protein n=1 Tax=Caminibacter mediatlanticus TB-2 TaxID=391592 RepID=A0AAI9AG14_9BACT|nr:hypothetical protein [Caminibacter mediatlanticus]EDM22951.1 hypothetical protein CMTB2_05582 [Caminibacter mediatlanticus TB-2]